MRYFAALAFGLVLVAPVFAETYLFDFSAFYHPAGPKSPLSWSGHDLTATLTPRADSGGLVVLGSPVSRAFDLTFSGPMASPASIAFGQLGISDPVALRGDLSVPAFSVTPATDPGPFGTRIADGAFLSWGLRLPGIDIGGPLEGHVTFGADRFTLDLLNNGSWGESRIEPDPTIIGKLVNFHGEGRLFGGGGVVGASEPFGLLALGLSGLVALRWRRAGR
jgi:hypothetical protein